MTTYSARALSSGCHTTRPRLELDLMDGDRRYGWIAGDRVGFVGFGDHVEAVQAAWVAHRTVMRRLARSPGAAPMSENDKTFALVRYAEDEVILANEMPIAVLVRPNSDGASYLDSYGFVIRVPGDADDIDVRATAYRIYLALKSSGIPWTLRRANVRSAPAQDTRSTNADHLAARSGDTTTGEDGGRSDDIDQSRQRARPFLLPQWGRRLRASKRERGERRRRRARDRWRSAEL